MHFPRDGDIGPFYLDQQGFQSVSQVKMSENWGNPSAIWTPARFMRPFRRCDSDVGHRGVAHGE